MPLMRLGRLMRRMLLRLSRTRLHVRAAMQVATLRIRSSRCGSRNRWTWLVVRERPGRNMRALPLRRGRCRLRLFRAF